MRFSRLRLILLTVIVMCMVFVLGACDECPHTDLEMVVKTESTCITAGEEYLVCNSCGLELKIGDLELAEHTYLDGECAVCGAKDPAAECKHELVLHEAKDPTCAEVGWAAYEECAKCDYTTYMEYEKLVHMPEAVDGALPGCETVGYTEGVKCSRCSEMLTAQEEIPALGHDEVTHEAKTPTCSEAGWDEYVTCSRCEYTTYNEKTAEHVEAVYPGQAATCTEVGYTDGVKCSACDTVLVEREEIPALGHDEVEHGAKAPTCTEAGWDGYVTCSRCDYTTKAEKPGTGHTEVVYSGYAATCNEGGLTDGVKCSACDAVLIEREPTPATGHKYDDGGDAECNECGYVRDVTCKHTATEIIPAQSATCTDTGLTKGLRCSDCGEIISEQIATDALGHDEVEHGAKAPTCTEIGWDGYVACSRCDYSTKVEKAEIGHKLITFVASEPTCTAAGWHSYSECVRCSFTTKTDETERPALGHDEIEHEAKEPTCTEVGWYEYVSCSRCDYNTYVSKPATGHTEMIVLGYDPKCERSGLTDGKLCSTCGTVLIKAEAIPATGHTESVYPGYDATCTEIGYTDGVICSACNTVLTEREPISATGEHNWVDATCASPKSCTLCGAVDEEYPALAHPIDQRRYYEDSLKEASCKTGPHYYCENESCAVAEFGLGFAKSGNCYMCGLALVLRDGNGEGYVAYDCELCGECEIVERPHVLAHAELVQGVKQATCKDFGFRAQYCPACGECADFTVIPPYSHVPGVGNNRLEKIESECVGATCDDLGRDVYICEACVERIVIEIPATGHSYTDGTCTNCGEGKPEEDE